MFPFSTALASVLLGIGGGMLLLRVLARSLVRQAGRDAADLARRTDGEAAARIDEAHRQQEQQGLALAAERRADRSRGELDLADYERSLDEREALLVSRQAQAATAEAATAATEERLRARTTEIEAVGRRTAGRREELLRGLEERGGLDREAALARAELERVTQWQLGSARRQRRAEEQAEQNAVTTARRVMAAAVDRYEGVGHLERVQNTIPIEDRPTLLALGDPTTPGGVVFRERVGCELWCDEAGGTITVRGDDPLAREIARRVLRQLANRAASGADQVQQVADVVIEEVHREVHNAARKAARALGVEDLAPEISELVGRLKFRLSYSQNQWKHAIEVGYLAGILADELGLDVRAARRGGLLHDIGKALTHEREGAHAVLGAQVARRCGEAEVVANAIGAHHNDEPPQTALALVVTAADAMSGARPGARRENAAAYLGRIQDIQRIAGGFSAVERVDIMHAGREVRIVVVGDERGDIDAPTAARHGRQGLRDQDLYPLAQEISRALEEEITFAGQIRVTVIRETRSVAVAR